MRAVFLPNNFLCPACSSIMFHYDGRVEAGQAGMIMGCPSSSCKMHDKRFLVELPTVEMTELLLPVTGETQSSFLTSTSRRRSTVVVPRLVMGEFKDV